MKTAQGTFTAWYRDYSGSPGSADPTIDGITATSREDLMAKVKARCPEGLTVKAIFWHHGGTSVIWYREEKKLEPDCWKEDICRRAFGI